MRCVSVIISAALWVINCSCSTCLKAGLTVFFPVTDPLTCHNNSRIILWLFHVTCLYKKHTLIKLHLNFSQFPCMIILRCIMMQLFLVAKSHKAVIVFFSVAFWTCAVAPSCLFRMQLLSSFSQPVVTFYCTKEIIHLYFQGLS